MANKRIIDLTATTTPSGYVALDHETNGTKKLDVTKISPVDSTLSSSSTNAVQNKVINTALSEKLATNGNSQNNTVAFTSGDVANDAAATSWTANVATLATGLTHANLFNRISTMMKNVRYLYNAVTKLNTDVNSRSSTYLTVTNGSGHVSMYKKGAYSHVRTADFAFTPTTTGWFTAITVPSDYKPYITVNFLSIDNNASDSSGLPIQTRFEETGDLKFYVTSGKVNTTISVLMSFTYLVTY